MEATTLPRQLLVTVDGGVNLANVRRAISMLKGVTKVKAQKPKAASKRGKSQACLSAAECEQASPEGKIRLYDPETGEYLNDETIKVIEDAHKGIGVTHYDSLQDFYKEMGL